MVRYRHIHLRGLSEAPGPFGAKGIPIKSKIPSVENRAAHGRKLRDELESAADQMAGIIARQAAQGVPAGKRGMLVSVRGREGVRLLTGNSRPTSRGKKLYTVRRDLSVAGQDTATFFLNRKNIDTLLSDLESYTDYETPDVDPDAEIIEEDEAEGTSLPRGFKLFETSQQFFPSSFRDLWTDDLEALPKTRDKVDWEVWIRSDLVDSFVDTVVASDMENRLSGTEFVEVLVHNVRATPEQIENLVVSTGSVVELRSASQFGDAFLNYQPEQRYAAAERMVQRIVGAQGSRPRVAVLDTGVDLSNPLLTGALGPNDCHTVVAGWGTTDHDGHGTKMAGVVQYLDLRPEIPAQTPIVHYTDLESVVVTAPAGAPSVSARWALQKAVELVERVSVPRVFCLAQTARGEAATGRVTATSAVLDLLAYGEGETPRLFCVAAGNVPMTPMEPYQHGGYADRNARFGIESPGQAFNAITVGGTTRMVQGQHPVAPPGDLSPTSRNALAWDRPHPNKPDIVLEAGNLEKTDAVFAGPSALNSVLTTAVSGGLGVLGLTGETSAATARAAGLMGRIMWSFPRYRPETVRALLVHSAEWTPAMWEEFGRLKAASNKTEATQHIFDRYGWGVPNEDRLWASATSDFTMVIEDEIQPYARAARDKPIRINEMKYFRMPWPKQALKAANLAAAELKCTLSYFIEPDPNAYARGRYDRYASARLEFDVKQHDERDEDAQAVYNRYSQGTARKHRYDGWDLGPLALRGSLHQDTWRGPAWALADRDGISVAPATGWWSEITAAARFDRKIRFSLVVSIRVAADVDLLAEASSKVRLPTLVEGAGVIST